MQAFAVFVFVAVSAFTIKVIVIAYCSNIFTLIHNCLFSPY